MRRAIDVSQVITSATPVGSTLPPDVRPSHSEPFSAVRRREDIMFLLRLENAHLGDDEVLDRFQYVTATADPAGTHVETYYPAPSISVRLRIPSTNGSCRHISSST
jgi:hypothetical protein